MQLQSVRKTASVYDRWIEGEGIPIFEAMGGVDDVTELPRKQWARMGGPATFIRLLGTTECERGIYVVEIPGGGALEPVRHMYDEMAFVQQGRGLTEVWQEGGAKVTFEWAEGSVFAFPLNTWHRMVNGSREPALILGVNTAPRMMNTVDNIDFIFNCPFQFTDRFGGESDFFAPGENRKRIGTRASHSVWETNFIPDVRTEFLDEGSGKVSGGRAVGYRMGKYWPSGHINTWPVGRYHQAHHHGPGAILWGVSGKGYCLLWDKELGVHPYQDGHEDKVVQVNWSNRSIYTPPDGWFHQHFSTGKEPAKLVAVYGAIDRPEDRALVDGNDLPTLVSIRDGGTLLKYDDEDPEIRRRYVEALREEGVECTMPEAVYRTG